MVPAVTAMIRVMMAAVMIRDQMMTVPEMEIPGMMAAEMLPETMGAVMTVPEMILMMTYHRPVLTMMRPPMIAHLGESAGKSGLMRFASGVKAGKTANQPAQKRVGVKRYAAFANACGRTNLAPPPRLPIHRPFSGQR